MQAQSSAGSGMQMQVDEGVFDNSQIQIQHAQLPQQLQTQLSHSHAALGHQSQTHTSLEASGNCQFEDRIQLERPIEQSIVHSSRPQNEYVVSQQKAQVQYNHHHLHQQRQQQQQRYYTTPQNISPQTQSQGLHATRGQGSLHIGSEFFTNNQNDLNAAAPIFMNVQPVAQPNRGINGDGHDLSNDYTDYTSIGTSFDHSKDRDQINYGTGQQQSNQYRTGISPLGTGRDNNSKPSGGNSYNTNISIVTGRQQRNQLQLQNSLNNQQQPNSSPSGSGSSISLIALTNCGNQYQHNENKKTTKVDLPEHQYRKQIKKEHQKSREKLYPQLEQQLPTTRRSSEQRIIQQQKQKEKQEEKQDQQHPLQKQLQRQIQQQTTQRKNNVKKTTYLRSSTIYTQLRELYHKSLTQWKEMDNFILKMKETNGTLNLNGTPMRQFEVTMNLIIDTITSFRQKSQIREITDDLKKESFDPNKVVISIDHESQVLLQLAVNLSKLTQLPDEIRKEITSLQSRLQRQIRESNNILKNIKLIVQVDKQRNSSNGINTDVSVLNNNLINTIKKKTASDKVIQKEETISSTIVPVPVPPCQKTENSASITNSTRKRKLNTKTTNINNLEAENSTKKKKTFNNDRKRRRSEECKNKPKKLNSKADESVSRQVVEEKKKTGGPTVRIKDDLPNRITNPLIEMPYYQSVPKQLTAPGSLPVETIPQGAEFWGTMPIYFPEPDTYPLSYFAKILGFDPILVNESVEGAGKKIDFVALRGNQCKSDQWAELPALGNFSAHLEGLKSTISKEKGEGMNEVDPMWRAILGQYRGFRDDLYKPSSDIKKDQVVIDDCISFAKRLKLFNDEEINFRTATLDDVMSLNQLNIVSTFR